METRIESWNCRYRLRQPASRGRLDDLARGPVLVAMATALRHALGDDPTVYLVRRLDCQWTVNRSALGNDDELARRWGEHLAAALVRAIREDSGSGNVVCYSDWAAHVAAFVEEILAGRAGDGWTFAAFIPHRRSTALNTLRAVLLAHAKEFGTIAARLQPDGALLRLLQTLDRETVQMLWGEGIARRHLPADTDRPLFAAALRILERLGGPAIERPRAEAWLFEFLTSQLAANWHERRSLSETVLAAFRFLRTRPGLGLALAEDRLDAALADLDWLDVAWLRSELEALLQPQHSSSRHAPNRRSISRHSPQRRAATPRQQEILTVLHQVLQRCQRDLDYHQLDSPGNDIVLFAALTAARPSWADDPIVLQLVQTVLQAAVRLHDSPVRAECLDAVRRADFGSLAQLLGPTAAASVQLIAKLGHSAIACVETLLPTDRPPLINLPDNRPTLARYVERTATQAAGVFLLLRAVSDLRVASLVRHSGYPPGTGSAFGRLLVALGTRWAGLHVQHSLDPGLALLVAEDITTVRDWCAQPLADDQEGAWRFQQALAEMAMGHNILKTGAPLRVALAVAGGGQLLVGGDEAAHVWPFMAPLDKVKDTCELLRQWTAHWEKVTNRPPSLIVPESLRGHCPRGVMTEIGADAPAELTALLQFLDVGSVGMPWFDATVTALAALIVRAWARWLKHLGGSSVPYLLGQFIRRGGSVVRQADGLLVELQPRPLDIVLQLSGYLEPVDSLVGLPVQRIRFRLGSAS